MTAIGLAGPGAMGSRIAGGLLESNQMYGTNRTRSSELTRRGIARRGAAASFQVLARAAGIPGAAAGSGMVTAGTGGHTP